MEAEDTSYIGNVFSFEAQGSLFIGGGIFHSNRDSLMPGDTMQFHFSVTYDTTNLPFYPEDLYFFVKDSLNSDTTLRAYTSRAKVYFTPWNTVELWSFDDFHSLKRLWLKRDGAPDRIYINKDSLPISDIIDTIPDDAFYRHVKGLAYAIPFIEPDTFNWDYPYDTTGGEMKILDGNRNVDRRDDGCGWWRRKFTARIQNLRIFTWYNPPNGGNTRVWLKNATVKVYVSRWPSPKVADLRTDDEGYIVDNNGNRTIDLDYCAGKNRNSLDMYFEIHMHDPESKNQLRVKMASSLNRAFIHSSVSRGVGYSASYPVISGTFGNNAGAWWEYEIPQEDLALTYTFLAWSFDYTNRELQGTGQTLGPNLSVKVQANTANAFYNTINKTIKLGMQEFAPNFIPYIWEGAVFHEFGHYVFYHLHGSNSWSKSGGTHTLAHNNKNSAMTMSEGVANGFEAIMDEMTWSVLGQSSNEAGFHNRTWFRNWGGAQLNHPYLSERYLATVMLDLWDGLQNYATYNNTIALLNPQWGPDRGDFIGLVNMDNFEMSFKDICRPFWENKGDVNTIEVYFQFLIKNASCSQIPSIRRIFQFNSENIDFATITNTADFPFFNSDEIFVTNQITATGFELNDDISIKRENEINFVQNRNFQVLNGNLNSYNVTRFKEYLHSILFWDRNHSNVSFSDNHRVENNATLQIHGNEEPRFYNNTTAGITYNQYDGDMNVSLCNGTRLEIGENGHLVIGSISPARKADFIVKSESRIILESDGDIVINNNSKLVIESGGRLDFHPGARIILNGPDAVLEVKGEIRMMQNADFTVEGGAQGFGYIKFHKNYNPTTPKLITGLGNNNIILEGNGASHKLIEITGGEGWFVPDHFTDVSISNCIITLGTDSRLNMENRNKLTVTNVEMKSIVGADRHKGLYVWSWGMYSEIDNLTVSGGIQGIYYYPINNDKQHSDLKVRYAVKTHVVKNSHFVDNIIGIKSIRVPVWMIDNEFEEYQTHGVSTYGSVGRNMYLLDNKFDNTGSGFLTTGLSYWGGMLGTLHLRKNEITGNHQAFNAFETRTIAGCNYIHDNTSIAMVVEGRSDLFINNGYNAAGRNKFEDNNSNILSRYNGRFAMEGGLNTFSAINSSTTATLPFFISGHLPSVYSSTNSLFDVIDNIFSPTLVAETNPGFLTQSTCNSNNNWNDYVINCAHPQFITALFYNGKIPPTGLADVGVMSSVIGTSECNEAFWSDLPELVDGMPKVYSFPEHFPVKWDHIFGSSAYLVNTPNYSNVPIKDVANDLYQRATVLDSETPSDIIDIYEDVLINTYVPSDSFHYAFYELYSQFLGNINHWINVGEIDTRVSDSLVEDIAFGQILDLIDNLILASSGEPSHFLYGQEFNLEVEKAELMRAASNYSQALLYLNNITAVEPIEFFIIDKLTCLNNAEKDLFSGAVSADSLFIVYGECLNANFDDPFFDSVSVDLKINLYQEKLDEKEELIQVWPNPAQDELNINILTEGLKPEFEIYNLVGTKVMSGRLQSGLQQINLSKIPSGIYIVKVNSGEIIKSFKIVVMK